MSILDQIKQAEELASLRRRDAAAGARDLLRDESAKTQAEQDKLIEQAREQAAGRIKAAQAQADGELEKSIAASRAKFDAAAKQARGKLPQAAAYIVGRIVK